MWQCGVQWEALIKGKGLSRAGNWTDSAICWTATALHPSLFFPPPPHFWSVTLIITYQHKHLPNYLRPGGVFCVSHPCRHLPGFSGCGGDDMKRARRLRVCVRGSTTRCQAAPAVCRTPAVFWHVGAQTNNATAHILLFLSYLQLWFPFSWVMQAQDSMSTAESLARHVTSSLAGVCLTRQKGPQR